jgi:hypothetical protein
MPSAAPSALLPIEAAHSMLYFVVISRVCQGGTLTWGTEGCFSFPDRPGMHSLFIPMFGPCLHACKRREVIFGRQITGEG